MHYRFLVAVCVLLCTCGRAPEEGGEEKPWQPYSFTNRATTTLTFLNTGPDSLTYHWADRQTHIFRGDSTVRLASGDSTKHTLHIYAPTRVRLHLPGLGGVNPHLLPGRDRVLLWNGSELMDGYSEYDPLRVVGTTLPVQGPTTPVMATLPDVLAFYEARQLVIFDKLDSLEATGLYPEWTIEMARREADLAAAAEVLTVVGYRTMMLGDTLVLPDTVQSMYDRYLTAHKGVTTPTHAKFLSYLSTREMADTIVNADFASFNARLKLAEMLSDRTEHGLDYLGDWLEGQLYDPRFYGAKEELVERGLSALPNEHRIFLTQLRDSLHRSRASISGVQRLLAGEFVDSDDEKVNLPQSHVGETVLYKLWFPGCIPCKRQYPHERALLRKHPGLRLIYIGYATRKDRWLEYVRTHEMPTETQLYLPGGTKPVQAALGMAGAPRYILVAEDGEVVCKGCPKPDDPSLARLIR